MLFVIIVTTGTVLPISNTILSIIPTCTLALFSALVWVIIGQYRTLKCQIEETHLHLPRMTENQAANRLHRWKICHLNICESVELLNQIFGITILLETVYASISFVLHTFFLIAENSTPGLKIFRSTLLIRSLTNTAIACYLSESITKEVII